MKYTTEQLEAIASKLREMPPVEKKKQEHSKQEAVRILSKEIAALQSVDTRLTRFQRRCAAKV